MIVKIHPYNIYHFRYESGNSGTDIDFVDTDNSTFNCTIYPSYEGRSQVLGICGAGGLHADVRHTGFDITSTGAIEFLFIDASPNDIDFYFTLYDGATRLVRIFYDESAYDYYYDNGGGNTIIYDGSTRAWRYISIRIDIDAGVNGQFDCYIYDVDWTELGSVTGIEFENNATTVDQLHLTSVNGVGPSYGFFDCFGITAEGSYIQGDIQYVETDMSDYVSDIEIEDGIIPFDKKCTFICHPNYETYFNKRDFIDVFDDDSNLLFTGIIIDKSRNKRGLYEFEADGMGNEIFDRTADTSFSGDDTDTKQKYLIDNYLKFCYRSSSIVGTTTTYDYEYNRAVAYLFYLARFLERQICYIEPGGLIYTKAYDGILKNDQYYGATYDFRDETVQDYTSSPTDLAFVDSATLYDGGLAIVSSWDNHKNVLRLLDDATAGEDPWIRHNETQATAGTREFWVGTNDVSENWWVYFYEGGNDSIIVLRIQAGNLVYVDSGGSGQTVQAVSNDTLYHLKVQWYADNTFDLYVDGTLKVDGVATRNNMVSGIDQLFIRGYGDSTDYFYFDAYGDITNDSRYYAGYNYAGWTLNSSYQNVFLTDIRGLEEAIPGYYEGALGITSTIVRYMNNIPAVRPASPDETFIIKRLNEFRDAKIQMPTEANQLGDNLFNIFSATTQFLGLRCEGVGWMQPGKTLNIQASDQVSITKGDFLILRVKYDPKNDIYNEMILTDNIIFPSEFLSGLDTTNYQIHSTAVQAFELQASTPHIWTGTAAPTIDETDGVKIGDLFVDTTNAHAYICIDATDGAPDWNQID